MALELSTRNEDIGLTIEAAAEAEYHLEEENDEHDTQYSALCCAGSRQRIITSELWLELKDLFIELIDYIKYRCWKKKLLTVFFAICACLVFYDLLFGKHIVHWLTEFVVWMKENPVAGIFAYIGIFIVATLMFVPEVLLVFAAGFSFSYAIGTWQAILAGTMVSLIGSFVSALIAFFRARYLMRDLVQLFARRYPLIMYADRALKRSGFRVILLLRLCPVIPFNGLNYICGVTEVSVSDFSKSLIGIIPFHLFTVTVGATAGRQYNLHENYNTKVQAVAFYALFGGGLFFGLSGILLVWRLVRKELQAELEISDSEMNAAITAVITHNDEMEAQEAGIEVSNEDDQWFWVWA